MTKESIKKRILEEIEISKRRLKAAKILNEKEMLEDAVNRIYYAAFYAAKAILNSIGFDAQTHSGLISEFGLRIIKEKQMERKYGRILRKAFEARESSDYHIGVIFEKEEVEKLLEETEDFLKKAENFVKERI
jgi:uncharacterized protein (UPF0332 family)